MSGPDHTTGQESRDGDAARELESLLAIGVVAGRVAHEINNPLASIQNAFLLVKDGIPATHPHYRYVGAIERAIQRIAVVARTFAETYSPEQDRATGVAVGSLVAEVVRLTRQTGGVTIEVTGQAPGAFAGPAGLLRHAVRQVLDVAARSTVAGDPITIDLSGTAGSTTVRVHYRDARSSVEAMADRLPHRLVRAMGAGLEVDRSSSGWTDVSLVLPANSRTEGAE